MKRRYLLSIWLILFIFPSFISAQNQERAKYIFLFIGDGMGIQQVNAAQVFADSVLHDTLGVTFMRFPVTTLATTYAANRYVTCSAAAGTALSTGHKTSIGTLGLNANHTDTLYSIATRFRDTGRKVAILTSVSIDHATPAAFYAHAGSRSSYYQIALDLLKSGYSFYGSGGFLEPNGSKKQGNTASIYELGTKAGYGFTSTFTGVDSLRKLGVKSIMYSTPNAAPEQTLQYEIDRKTSDVSLADLTRKAIEVVDNPKGFFMMVEGGKVDWACHDNDAATAIHEVLALSRAVNVALDFYSKHPSETLIIVTADHETGGMSLGNNANGYDLHLPLLSLQKVSAERLQSELYDLWSKNPKATFEEYLGLLEDRIGLSENGAFALTADERNALEAACKRLASLNAEESKNAQKNAGLLAGDTISILNRKAGVGWTSHSHTGSPVPVFVTGDWGSHFTKLLDNTDIPKLILNAAGI
jgi:alkaline phosphatase